MNFPIFKTKVNSVNQIFNFSDPEQRKKYFEAKAGPEIKKIRDYLKENSFVAYLMGKKNSGKGTYSKLFIEIMGQDLITHFSIGDLVRNIHKEIEDPKKKEELIKFLKKNYRGFMPIEEALAALEARSTKTLLPTEFILALVKKEINKLGKKALFIDGFPREIDQVSYSLFFRDLIDYRDDPDIFILIDLPETIINERIKSRVICPVCSTPRSLKLLPTKEVGYDKDKKEYYLICDNPTCQDKKIRMIGKEGDSLGTAPIKDRLELDGKLMERAFNLHGIPKILLRNSVPVDQAKEYVDDYEITPAFEYQYDEKNNKVEVMEKLWTVPDEEGTISYSLMPPPVVLSMIKQMVEVLGL